MEEVYYAIKMSDGGYLGTQQENNWSVDVYSYNSIRLADMWKESVVEQSFNDLKKGNDEHFDFDFRTEARPEKIVKVTMRVEE